MSRILLCLLAASILTGTGLIPASAADRPNILMIMTDDVGYWNVAAYSHGMMGVPTPHIDRLAREGLLFTDHYAEPTCTPGRAAFITGQRPIRTGLTTVGMPGSPIGLDQRDPTLAEVLRPLGYRTGQFGKNHLGDRNEHLPTVHGFEVFYGNLYHLNTEEEPELGDWPKDSGFNQRYRPRGVLESMATDKDDDTVDPRFGRVGKQTIRDTGPLTRKRMETVDDEFLDHAVAFMRSAVKDKKPFFVWHNPTRMHIYTHLREERRGQAAPYTSEMDIYGSGMMELDAQVGRLLKELETLGVADNTIVLFTADNGAMVAGRRHYAVPGREGDDLGRGCKGASAGALAGKNPGWQGIERHPGQHRSVRHPGDGCRRAGCRPAIQGFTPRTHRRHQQPRTLDRQCSIRSHDLPVLQRGATHGHPHWQLEIAHDGTGGIFRLQPPVRAYFQPPHGSHGKAGRLEVRGNRHEAWRRLGRSSAGCARRLVQDASGVSTSAEGGHADPQCLQLQRLRSGSRARQ